MPEIKALSKFKLGGRPRMADLKVFSTEPQSNMRARVVISMSALDEHGLPEHACSLRFNAEEARRYGKLLIEQAEIAERLDKLHEEHAREGGA